MENSSSLCIALAIVLWIAACSEQKSVDQDYLRSQQYNEFKKRTMMEARRKGQKPLTLKAFLEQFRNCSNLPLKPLPVHFDGQDISELSQAAPDSCSFNTDLHRFKLIAETFTSNHILRWILLERKTAYRDQELVVSTFRDEELRSFKTVGIYKKNLSERVMSNIHVRPDNGNVRILTQTTRNIAYPIQQTNNIETMYDINKLGDISELQGSAFE